MKFSQRLTFRGDRVRVGHRFWAGLAAALICAGSTAYAQSFTLESNIVIRGVAFGSVAWGDYDRNGTLDVAVSGNAVQSGQSQGYVTELFRNTGGDFVKQTGTTFTGGYFPGIGWGDYNSDGLLDLLVASSEPPALPRSEVWRNLGNNTFSVETNIALTGVDFASVAWGDYDNDGRQDILLAGFTGVPNTAPVSRLYRNQGGGSFIFQPDQALVGVESCAVAWGDYDNDGDLDILLTGAGDDTPVSKVYRNNGGGIFSEQGGIVLEAVSASSAAWGDYDNDGFLDIVLAGTGVEPNNASIAKLYRNLGNGTFQEQANSGLSGLSSPSLAWGDYDNDGRLDLVLTGSQGSPSFTPVAKVYRNNGNHTFSDQVGALQPPAGLQFSRVAWGDYDNDGRLDVLATGLDNTSNSTVTRIFRNVGQVNNEAPSAPSGLTVNATPFSGVVRLTWQAAADDKTPASGLTYNLRIGTTPGDDDVMACMANTGSGKRFVPALGNVNANRAWFVRGLNPSKTYFWSVQAVDTAFAGSGWATEDSFPGQFAFPVLSRPVQPDFDDDNQADLGVFLPRKGEWYMRQSTDGELFSGGPFPWGWSAAVPVPEDYDGDGRADVAVYVQSEGKWYILRSVDGGSQILTVGGVGLVPVTADYDGDGRADVGVYKPSTGEWTIRLSQTGTFKNGGTFAFGWSEAIPVPGDYDHDGKADIAVYWPQGGLWYISLSSTGGLLGGGPQAWGYPGTLPVQGDYDGDGKTDQAVYDPSNGNWYVRASSTGVLLGGSAVSWGAAIAEPVPNDYTGDGKTDIAVYVPKTGKWYIRKSDDGTLFGGGNSASAGTPWGHPQTTPANAQYQTLRALNLVP